MTTRCPQSSRLALVAILGALASLAVASNTRAQSMLGSDPYRPYNSGYESYSLPPSASINYQAINTQRARTYSSSANQMSQFYDDLYGTGGPGGTPGQPDTARRPGGSNYYDANRAYDQEFGRVYQPNKNDGDFYKDQQERTKEYFKALAEKDPKIRAEKLRAIDLKNLQAARSLSPNNRLPANSTTNTTARAARPTTATRGVVGLPSNRTPAAGAASGRTPTPGGTATGTRSTLTPASPSTTLPATPLSGRGTSSLLDPSNSRGGAASSTLPGSASSAIGIGADNRSLGTRYSMPATRANRTNRERPSDVLKRALDTTPASGDDAEPAVAPLFPSRGTSSTPR
jgi:hypothetical protein